MQVLALIPGEISDQLLFFPTLEHLKQELPNAEISIVADPAVVSAYRVSKIVDQTIPFPFGKNNSPADWANLLGVVRDREYELAITTSRSWSVGLLLWLSGIPTRIGYGGGANNFFLTATVPVQEEQYLAQQYHDLLLPLDLQGTMTATAINVPQGDITWVNQQMQSLGIGDQGYVLLYPGLAEGRDRDTYPVEGWQAIIQDFQKRQPGLPLVLLQQPETAEAIKTLTQTMPTLRVIRPDNLGQVAAAIAGANLLLTTDSYVSELGTALKVFTLALFGKNHPDRRLPPTEGTEQRFVGIQSPSDRVADIPVVDILQKIWGEG
jgi:ADP-heptose:LPS heptosyltransferase